MKYLLMCLFLYTGNCYAQTSSKTIIADGQAKVKIKPDVAILSLSVSKSDTIENAAMQKLNQEVQALSTILTKQGLDKSQIKIADYSIESNSYRDDNKKEFTASNTLKVELHVQEPVINQLLSAIEAQQLNDLEIAFDFRLSDSLKKKTRLLLVQQAITDAKANAVNIARALNVELKRIKQVAKKGDAILPYDNKIEFIRYTPPVVVEKLEDMRINSAFQQFEIEELDLTEEITIVYEI